MHILIEDSALSIKAPNYLSISPSPLLINNYGGILGFGTIKLSFGFTGRCVLQLRR